MAISPRPHQAELPIWLGVGGTPESARRAGTLGLPMILANISKPPATFAGQIADYRKAGADAGHDARRLRVAVAAHCHVDRDSRKARDDFYPHYAGYFRSVAPKTSAPAEVPRSAFDERAAPKGPLFVGSPQEIVDKVLYERELFGHDRFLAQIDLGGLPYARVARSIELLATEVAPVLRKVG
jgi:alkanesulfonate monooxygenase SsuD/methylene tetrahydromethanopterin reductase-like flavin-dependent oxidoreductase (luciferase family)